MQFTNRFLRQIGNENRPDLASLFERARLEDSAEVIEAMRIISDRRRDAGDVIGIDEITRAIPHLIADRQVMDAAIDICVEGLVGPDRSREHALELLLDSLTRTAPSQLDDSQLESTCAVLMRALTKSGGSVPELPAFFGPRIGDDTPRYELRRVLGRGSQGIMYEATDRAFVEEGDAALVAIKIYHSALNRSGREGSRARRIRHKNVARVIDQGESDNGDRYVTYELIEGQPMDAWKRQQPGAIGVRAACRLVRDIALGVQSIHAAGVSHRDLKPSNILMNREGEPVITDFGIAGIARPGADGSGAELGRGSLAFIAPEQYQEGEESGPLGDIYSLGGLLYWLLFDQYPNGDTADEATRWLTSPADHTGPGATLGPARPRSGDVPPRLWAIIAKALEIDPSGRYQGAGVLAQDLDDFLHYRPIVWLDTSPWTKVVLFTRRNPKAMLANAAIVLLVGYTVWAWGDHRRDLQLAQTRSAAALDVQNLNHQLDLERQRLEEVKNRAGVVKTLLQTWSGVLGEEGDATTNLLFLQALTYDKFLRADPELMASIYDKRVESAEAYLATLDPMKTSPLRLAMWHELLAAWYVPVDEEKSGAHLRIAIDLVEQHAPGDSAWLEQLRDAERAR